MDARWIVAFGGDRPASKSWPVDELRPYPDAPAAWADIVTTLIDGPFPARYLRSQWPDPPGSPFDWPTRHYAVLHVGASTPLKQWDPARWRDLAAWLSERGIEPVWSAGRGEEAVAQACIEHTSQRSYAGVLSLPQLWHLVATLDAAERRTGDAPVCFVIPKDAIIRGKCNKMIKQRDRLIILMLLVEGDRFFQQLLELIYFWRVLA